MESAAIIASAVAMEIVAGVPVDITNVAVAHRAVATEIVAASVASAAPWVPVQVVQIVARVAITLGSGPQIEAGNTGISIIG
jgi:hypothetical protein